MIALDPVNWCCWQVCCDQFHFIQSFVHRITVVSHPFSFGIYSKIGCNNKTDISQWWLKYTEWSEEQQQQQQQQKSFPFMHNHYMHFVSAFLVSVKNTSDHYLHLPFCCCVYAVPWMTTNAQIFQFIEMHNVFTWDVLTVLYFTFVLCIVLLCTLYLF